MSGTNATTVDLQVVLAWTAAAAIGVLWVGLPPSPLRLALVLPVVLLFPGYALVSVLYPAGVGSARARRNSREERDASLTLLERLTLSMVVSLVLVPAVGFLLNFTRYGIRLTPYLVAVTILVGGFGALGLLARASVAPQNRFRLSLGIGGLAGTYLSKQRRALQKAEPFVPQTETQRLLNLLFVAALVTTAAGFGFAATTPHAGDDTFTELYLLQQTDDGEYLAEALPHQFQQGQTTPLYVAIGNHERQTTTYTVVTKLGRTELDRFRTRVGAGGTKRVKQPITPTRTGDNLRLSFLLYRGKPPGNPTRENAYRTVHLWITVE